MAKKKEKKEKKIVYTHREDAEWLTKEICNEYVRRARELNSTNAADIGQRRQLRIELQNRCDITELDALNIINGFHIGDCVLKYERIRSILEGTYVEEENDKIYTEEYLAWLAEKEEKETAKYDEFKIEDDD